MACTDDDKEDEGGKNTTTKHSQSGKAQTEPERKRTLFASKDLVQIARTVVECKTLLEPHRKKTQAWITLKEYLVEHGFRHKSMAPDVIQKKSLSMVTYKKVRNLSFQLELFFHDSITSLEPR